ncbi:hypothetical protein D9M71_831910 [compost metagenome]
MSKGILDLRMQDAGRQRQTQVIGIHFERHGLIQRQTDDVEMAAAQRQLVLQRNALAAAAVAQAVELLSQRFHQTARTQRCLFDQFLQAGQRVHEPMWLDAPLQ